MGLGRHAKRVVLLVIGATLLLVGIALLVLPGPGLLLVLAGLITLAAEFPAVEKYVNPVRERALQATEESVRTPFRIACSVLAGLALIGAGIVWGLYPQLPLGGWPTGSGLVISGLILLGLLAYSYRKVKAKRSGTPG